MFVLCNANPNCYPINQKRTLIPSPPTLHLNSSSAGTICRERKRWSQPDNQICKVIHNHVSSVSQEYNVVDSTTKDFEAVKTIAGYVFYIKERLSSIGDGRISLSPYDTAWVALIKDINGHDDRPQFPSSLEWIAQNQLSDGSWGDEHYFIAYDRLLNTLACVVALRSWSVHADKSEKGITFINENLSQLEDANVEHMTCGFEIVFPTLLLRAQKLGIDNIQYDAPVIKELHTARDERMKKIPKELMYKLPTSLLFSLEGFDDLDWQRLLKLQAKDGSFLTSPSSTAFAFMETKDAKCFRFIKNTVEQFNGGVPHTYPVDTFARLWAVDRLQRLGISRYFQSEINDCLSYIYKFWRENGIFSARDAGFSDIDDTAMGFRLLRLHGYNVSPNVFKYFKVDDKYSCYGGQMIEAPTPIYSLYRASQLLFPGEEILEETMQFSFKFLTECLASNKLLDKWVISKNLPDEIQNGLEIPWYSSLPRVETRLYIEQYTGANEIWNGKTWYRMYDISNNEYLELAKLDFNKCQAQHQIEWDSIQEWYDNYKIEELGISKKELLLAFFLATASIFEPERSMERTAWAKSQIISKMITNFYTDGNISFDQKVGLLTEFRSKINGRSIVNCDKRAQGQRNILLIVLAQLLEVFEENIRHQLKDVWDAWLLKISQGTIDCQEYAELYATILNICAGHITSDEILAHAEYKLLSQLTNKICHRLSEHQNEKVIRDRTAIIPKNKISQIEQDMQFLLQLVLQESGGINRNVKQTFLLVAKTYFYSTCIAAQKSEIYISKVLFERVIG